MSLHFANQQHTNNHFTMASSPRAPSRSQSMNASETRLSRNVSSRRLSHSQWLRGGKVCLDVRRLEELICIDLPRMTRHASPKSFAGLSDRYEASSSRDDSGNCSLSSSMGASITSELDYAAHHLMQVVNDSKNANRIPPPLLSEIHSFCGLIHDMNRDPHSAMQSHLRAVWLARKQTNCNQEQVKASANRLEVLCKAEKVQIKNKAKQSQQ
ncbi:hypothetical protein MPSEU_000052000 [Mayamaea pseudoterrestris]|nr:hypothetical protein MPSEU_000052000 [Mayamaea pseudoterrestris]